MGDLRSQLKATSMKSLKKRIEQDDNMFGAQKSEYLQLEDGKTQKIRIFRSEERRVGKECSG